MEAIGSGQHTLENTVSSTVEHIHNMILPPRVENKDFDGNDSIFKEEDAICEPIEAKAPKPML